MECLMAVFNKEDTGLSTLQKGNANLWPVIVVSEGERDDDTIVR